jgi:hypothetical protein
MKYYIIDSNINRGIRVEPVENTKIYPCDNPDYFRDKEFKIYNRKWVPDIFGMNCIGWPVISEKFKKVLEENGFTGYRLVPIKIRELEGNYYILVPTNIAKRKEVHDEDEDMKDLRTYVDLKGLQKADISKVEGSRSIYVNEKVLKALKKNKIKNLDISYTRQIDDDTILFDILDS